MLAISTSDLTKYYGRSRGIEGVNLDVRDGEVFGFIGPNGAGKSTTIRTLLGLLRPTRGSAAIFELDIAEHGNVAYPEFVTRKPAYSYATAVVHNSEFQNGAAVSQEGVKQ